MKKLQALYPYLTENELRGRFNEGVRILLKIKRFSNKIAAARHLINGLNNGDAETLNFFSQYKREKAPIYQILQNAKGLHASMPKNSKLTITL